MGCSTGRSAGLAPLRILSTNVAARRCMSAKSGLYDNRPPALGYADAGYMPGRRLRFEKSTIREILGRNQVQSSTNIAWTRSFAATMNALEMEFEHSPSDTPQPLTSRDTSCTPSPIAAPRVSAHSWSAKGVLDPKVKRRA